MKIIPLIVVGSFALLGSLRAQTFLPTGAVAAVPGSLQSMRDALKQLRNPPKLEAEAFLSGFNLIEAADEYARRDDPAAARFLYEQAAAGLQELALLRPDWEPEVVAFRIKDALQKIAAMVPPPADAMPPGRSHLQKPASGEPPPKGAKEFEFNGQKVYLVPLGG